MKLRRPKGHFWMEAIRSEYSKTMSTYVTGSGTVEFERTEWGFGKGRWKRRVRESALQLGLQGETKVRWMLFVSFYHGEYKGPSHLIEVFFDAI